MSDWTPEDLARLVPLASSWRDLGRRLSVSQTMVLRKVRPDCEELGLDTSHFNAPSVTKGVLAPIVAASTSWADAQSRLGDGAPSITALTQRAIAYGISTDHFAKHGHKVRSGAVADSLRSTPLSPRGTPAGIEALFIAWLSFRGIAVSRAPEGTAYDLIADFDGGLQRIQVKSCRRPPTGRSRLVKVAIGMSRSGRNAARPYEPNSFDLYLVMTSGGDIYAFPLKEVQGRRFVSLGIDSPYFVETFALPGGEVVGRPEPRRLRSVND